MTYWRGILIAVLVLIAAALGVLGLSRWADVQTTRAQRDEAVAQVSTLQGERDLAVAQGERERAAAASQIERERAAYAAALARHAAPVLPTPLAFAPAEVPPVIASPPPTTAAAGFTLNRFPIGIQGSYWPGREAAGGLTWEFESLIPFWRGTRLDVTPGFLAGKIEGKTGVIPTIAVGLRR
jgi:hypothetical protein